MCPTANIEPKSMGIQDLNFWLYYISSDTKIFFKIMLRGAKSNMVDGNNVDLLFKLSEVKIYLYTENSLTYN